MSASKPCPFCEIAATASHERVVLESTHAFVIKDGFPISEGHTLVIPKRHVGSFFDLNEVEQSELLMLLAQARDSLKAELGAIDFNIGINDGPLAGQTVAHCHVHLIPRFKGDTTDPRGGVRWIIPAKAAYWD